MSVEAITRRSNTWADLVAQRGPLWSEWSQLWNSLDPGERDPATHPAWQTAWLAGLDETEHDVRVFVCRDGARLLAVLPLEVAPLDGQRYSLTAPVDVPLEGASLAVAASDLPQVLEMLLVTPIDDNRTAVMLEFGQVDNSHVLLGQSGPACRIEQAGERSVIPVPEDPAELREQLGSNLRGNLRKARNKLNRYTDARIDELQSPADIGLALERLAEVEARSWKAEHGTDFASDSQVQQFFATAIPQLAAEGRALAHVLHADGRDIGAHLSLRLGDELLVHKIAFDADYKECAPGNLLLEHLLEYAVRNGIPCVNLVTSLPWHDRWKPIRVPTHRVQVFPEGIEGILTRLQVVPVRDRLRNWTQRLGLLDQIRSLREQVQGN